MRSRKRAGLGALATAVAVAATVAQPASGQIFFPCQISGGGQIVTASGDTATLGVSVTGDGIVAAGNEVYVDHGPATPVRFRSVEVVAVVCNPDARRAEIVGAGEVDTVLGQEPVGFRIAVFDARASSVLPDRYGITLTNGYESGEQPVVHGNIEMHGR